ncbi:MAG TPA: cytochrome c peroxidase [Candidatus Saccharimonadales bacterium]|nr:cytochrome c peroxidase [Candidatus Saccharimonadales bacterium]
MNRKYLLMLGLACAAAFVFASGLAAQTNLTPKEQLGKMLYFDTNLSNPTGMACAACHAPEVGFTGPVSDINAAGAVYPGAVPTRAGNRKPPSASYAAGPVLYYDSAEETWVGGTFWDGRASGWTLGDPLAEQAQGPFLNPVEMNLATPADVCAVVAASSYKDLFEQVWGMGSVDCGAGLAAFYDDVGYSISAYERSTEVMPFTSKYDYYLKGEAKLSGQEKQGLRLFEGKAMCANCHILDEGQNGEPPMFTDFTYDNLGVPKNPQNPYYTQPPWVNPDGAAWIDKGLGQFLAAAGFDPAVYMPEMGKQKVPSLRNVDLRPYQGFVKAYGHNGYFKSLESIVHFYNTRDVYPDCATIMSPKEGKNCWPAPEYAATVNHDELGDLGLKPREEEALVYFLKTLSDGYRP